MVLEQILAVLGRHLKRRNFLKLPVDAEVHARVAAAKDSYVYVT